MTEQKEETEEKTEGRKFRIDRDPIANGNPFFNKYTVRRRNKINTGWTDGSKRRIKQVYNFVKNNFCWEIEFSEGIMDDLSKYEKWRMQQYTEFGKIKSERRSIEAKV